MRWGRGAGFEICCPEVRLPASNYRVDVAACRKPANGGAEPGETAVFECKQASADLLKDSRREASTRRRLAALALRQKKIEAMLANHLPNLRHGDTLFPEYDTLELDGFQHGTLQKVQSEAEKLSRHLYGGTKFDRIVRYRAVDFCYLVIRPELFAGYAPPEGWGLLVADGDELELKRRPTRLDCGAALRLAMLVAMARKKSG